MPKTNYTGGMDWAMVSPSVPDQKIHVNVATQQELLQDLKVRLQKSQGFSIATLNLDHVVKLRRDDAFRIAYAAQTHVTADGNPIVWLSHLAGQRSVSLIPGSELITPVATLAADLQLSVAFFGATKHSLDAAAKALVQGDSRLSVVLTNAPEMGFDPMGTEAIAAIDAIRDSGARVVFVALGAPKQERFVAFAQTKLPHVGFLSIGAGLDFVSGAQHRAPTWIRALALEWLWRLLGNPRRLAARYWGCFAVLPALVRAAVRARRQSYD